MQELRNWDKLIAGLKYLRAQTLEPGHKWKLSGPYVRHRAESLRERREILGTLVSVWSFLALWSSGDMEATFRWSFPNAERLEQTVESLYEGEWVLLFFADDAHLALRDIGNVPTHEDALKRFASDLGACAVIMSYVDDNEWLLFINE